VQAEDDRSTAGAADAPPGLVQDVINVLAFDLGEGALVIREREGVVARVGRQRLLCKRVIDAECGVASEDDRTLDDVLQLTDVARPVVGL